MTDVMAERQEIDTDIAGSQHRARVRRHRRRAGPSGVLRQDRYRTGDTGLANALVAGATRGRPRRRRFAGLGLAIYDMDGTTETTSSVTVCGAGHFRLGTVGLVQPGIEMAIAEDGFLNVVDRRKEMIITSAGKNIAPPNIENLRIAAGRPRTCQRREQAVRRGDPDPRPRGRSRRRRQARRGVRRPG